MNKTTFAGKEKGSQIINNPPDNALIAHHKEVLQKSTRDKINSFWGDCIECLKKIIQQ